MKEAYFSNIQCNRPTVSTCTTFLYKATHSESSGIGESQHRCYTQLWEYIGTTAKQGDVEAHHKIFLLLNDETS